MTPLKLEDAWQKLLSFTDTLGTPKGYWDSTFNAYNAWGARLSKAYETGTPGGSPFIPASEMELWMKSYGDFKAFADQAAVRYPKIVPKVSTSSSGKVIQGEAINVEGKLAWWYWPLRVGAGVGAGYALYRVLTPTRRERYHQRRQALAGR